MIREGAIFTRCLGRFAPYFPIVFFPLLTPWGRFFDAVSWSLFWCFLIRAVCYSYTPISGRRATKYPVLDTIMYPLCFYHIAEIIPAAIVGWSMLSDRDDRGIKKRFERGEICMCCNKEPQERETGFGDALKMKMKSGQQMLSADTTV